MNTDRELLEMAVDLLADWCYAVQKNGTGWDDWDEHYKTAAYRPHPLRKMIDEAIGKIYAEQETSE